MKKKLWLTALMASGAACLLLGFAACGEGSGSSGNSGNSGNSNREVSGNLCFTLDSSTDTYSVSKNDSDGPLSGALEIPATFQGKPVTRIRWEGFSGCSGLTSIKLKNGQSPQTAAKINVN